MNTRTKLIAGTVALAALVGGLAFATPIVGLVFGAILSTGSTNSDVNVRAHVAVPATATASEVDFEAQLETEGPSTFITQDVSYLPGGHTGWHTHPGILLVSMTEGSLEWYDANCKLHVYSAGDSFTENTQLHYARNVGTVNNRFMVTYVLAKGQPRRIDKAAPACAAALGLL